MICCAWFVKAEQLQQTIKGLQMLQQSVSVVFFASCSFEQQDFLQSAVSIAAEIAFGKAGVTVKNKIWILNIVASNFISIVKIVLF